MSTEKRRSFWFPVFLAVLVLINGLAIFVGLQKLEEFLEGYEAQTPASAVEGFLRQANAGDYGGILDGTGFSESRFVHREHGEKYLAELFGGAAGHLQAAKDPASAGDYYIYDSESDTKLATLSTEQTEGGWALSLSYPKPEGEVKISAPEGASVYVNGVLLEGADKSGETVTVAGFAGVTADIPLPQTVPYTAGGFYGEPEITALDENGVPLTVEHSDGGGTVLPAAAEGDKLAAASQLITETAETYARFITEDATFDELGARLYPKTEFYGAVRGFYNGWYVDHDTVEFRELAVENVSYYGEDAFSGDISFDYVIKKGAREFLYPSAYRMHFLLVDGAWKCVFIETK